MGRIQTATFPAKTTAAITISTARRRSPARQIIPAPSTSAMIASMTTVIRTSDIA